MDKNNEITVKLNCSIKEIKKILKEQNFIEKENFTLDDTFYCPKDKELDKNNLIEILNSLILIRKYKEDNKEKICFVYKNKEINKKGEILKQSKVKCEIKNIKQGEELLKSLNYFKLMNIKEKSYIYEDKDFSILVKDVKNQFPMLEIELNKKYNTIDKLKNKLNSYNLPIETNNYFVKKAEIELLKIINNN